MNFAERKKPKRSHQKTENVADEQHFSAGSAVLTPCHAGVAQRTIVWGEPRRIANKAPMSFKSIRGQKLGFVKDKRDCGSASKLQGGWISSSSGDGLKKQNKQTLSESCVSQTSQGCISATLRTKHVVSSI